jgi:hypothetical protein
LNKKFQLILNFLSSSIVLFGNKNRASAKHTLGNNVKKYFERGQTDIFKIHSNYVGPLSKIRIEHDNTGKNPGCKFFFSV